jgi:hypothetical protein
VAYIHVRLCQLSPCCCRLWWAAGACKCLLTLGDVPARLVSAAIMLLFLQWPVHGEGSKLWVVEPGPPCDTLAPCRSLCIAMIQAACLRVHTQYAGFGSGISGTPLLGVLAVCGVSLHSPSSHPLLTVGPTSGCLLQNHTQASVPSLLQLQDRITSSQQQLQVRG